MRKISNKKIAIVTMFLLITSAFPLALAETSDGQEKLADDVLYARYLTLHQRKEAVIIAMDAVIDLYNENGISTSELTGLKNKLNELDLQAKEAAKNVKRDDFYETIEESRETIKTFTELTKENNIEGQKEAVKAALEENKEYLTGLREETAGVKKDIFVSAVDNRIEKLEQISSRLEENGADVTEINAKINEISVSRATISEESDWETLKSFFEDAKEDTKELREMIKKAIEEIKEQK